MGDKGIKSTKEIKMKKENRNLCATNTVKRIPKWVLWLNLVVGIYNLYLFVNNGSWFIFILGAVNIGVWVFNTRRLK